MGAYNDLIIEDKCPACVKNATIRCQMHVGASFAGDSRGRFAMQEYRLGQQMAWWPQGNQRYESWSDEADRKNDDGSVDECSYAGCDLCHADLYVGVRFRDLVPVQIISIGENRPDWRIH